MSARSRSHTRNASGSFDGLTRTGTVRLYVSFYCIQCAASEPENVGDHYENTLSHVIVRRRPGEQLFKNVAARERLAICAAGLIRGILVACSFDGLSRIRTLLCYLAARIDDSTHCKVKEATKFYIVNLIFSLMPAAPDGIESFVGLASEFVVNT